MNSDNNASPAASPQSLRDEGVALLRQGDFPNAARLLTDAVEADPRDESAWRFLGAALASTGDYGRAVPAFERAIALSPENARNYYNLALAYQATERATDARTAAARSVALDASYQPAQQLLRTLGGTVPSPVAPPAATPVMPPPSAIPPPLTPPASPASSGMGSIGGGITPPPLMPPGASPAALPNTPPAPPPTPAAPPATGMPTLGGIGGGMPTLGGIGGGMPGLGSIGGGAPAAAPAAPAPVATPPASGGLASVGGPLLREQPPVAAAVAPPSPYGSSVAYAPPGAYAPTPVMVGGAYAGASVRNSSGLQADVPPEVAAGFNFGAAIITFWWLRSHNLRQISWGISGVYVVLRLVARLTGVSSIYIVLLLIQAGMFFVMGFMGNRLAWQNRAFTDVEDFKACQRTWMYWAIPLFCLEIALFVFAFTAAFAAKNVAGALPDTSPSFVPFLFGR